MKDDRFETSGNRAHVLELSNVVKRNVCFLLLFLTRDLSFKMGKASKSQTSFKCVHCEKVNAKLYCRN